MSQYYQSPRSQSGMYVPLPVDREALGEKKVEALQRQIAKLENDQQKRREMIERLSNIQNTQDRSKQEQQNRVLERYNKKNIPLPYDEEKYRNTGKIPTSPREIEKILAQRTRDFSQKQHESAIETQYLVKERERLQAARDRIREQRRVMLSPAGSAMSEPDDHYRSSPMTKDFSRMSVRTPRHDVDSYVQKTIATLPQTMDRIAQLRQDVQKHYNIYQKPYRGELGIQTYHPWQMKTYFMCREIVDDVVNEFLDLHFTEAIPMVEKETYYATIDQRHRDRQMARETVSERKAVQLVLEDILLDVTGDMCLEVAQEDKHSEGTVRNLVDQTIINRAECVVMQNEEGRQPNDKAYNVVTKQYYSSQDYRNSKRSDVFYHTLKLSLKPDVEDERRPKLPPSLRRPPTEDKKKPVSKKEQRKKSLPPSVPPSAPPSQPASISEQEDPDTIVLEYHPIAPVDIRIYDPLPTDTPQVKITKEKYKSYSAKEVSYWNNMIPYISEVGLPKRFKGVNLVSSSPNSTFIVFASTHGDMVIYDTAYEPWRPVKVMMNESRSDDPVINCAWSLDCQRFISITHSGSLNVWTFTGGIQKSDPRKMGIRSDDTGTYPQLMGLLLDMDAAQKDFTFHEGQLAEEGVLNDIHYPTKSAFFPSFSFLGIQDNFCVGLENGDILKCDLEFVLNAPDENETHEYVEAKRIYNPMLTANSQNLNIIGRGVEGELLRQHKHKIIYLGFIDHINDLISVDHEGYIFIWRYAKEHLSNVGWFKPIRKFKLSKSKDMYEPTDGKPKLVFTDMMQSLPGKRTRTRQEIANQRLQVTNTINNMLLGDPWHVEMNDTNNTVTEVYAPKGGVKDTGAVFHIVIKHRETDQLSSYVTRVYKPVKIKYTKMSVIPTADGNGLIFMLLFPSYAPKEPHITITIFDLKLLELRDFRRDLYLSEAEYAELKDNDVVYADVSRVFGPTGSEYFFITILGDIKAISLTTGRQVLKMEDPDERSAFRGCVLDTEEIKLFENSQVSVLSTRGKIFAVFSAPKSNRVIYVEFEDENQSQRRRQMYKFYDALDEGQKRLMPTELRVDTLTSDLADKQHPSVAMRALVLECMDNAIQLHHKARFTNKQKDDFMLFDKEMNYKAMEKHISQGRILTGK